MLTLGIDPGTAILGFGLVEESGRKLKAHEHGCLRTKKEAPGLRLHKLYLGLKDIIKDAKPDVIAVEQLFFCNNQKTAISVGEARGIILLSAAESGLQVFEYTPLEVKMALTGYGKADKKQIQSMVKRLLGLENIPKPDDAADALAIAICHLHSYKLKKL